MAVTATKTAAEIILAAHRKIGVQDKDESIDSQDQADALEALDMMLKTWQLDGVRRYTKDTESITVTDATASYSISPRLHQILAVNWKDDAGVETPLLELTHEQYWEQPNKSSAGRATQYYYDRRAATGTLFVWPVLATASSETIEILGSREVEDLTSASDVLDIPSELYEAAVYGLAARIQTDFGYDNQFITQMAAGLEQKALGFESEDVSFAPEEGYFC
jgi:hypothetical protein